MVAQKTHIFTILIPGTVAGFVLWLLLQSSGEAANLTPSLWLIGLLPLLLGVGLYFWCAGAFTDHSAKERQRPLTHRSSWSTWSPG